MVKPDKSLITNLTAALVTAAAFFSPVYREHIFSTGAFALSGAFTNWLAVHMLFEKIPFIYGSGVVPLHFEDFKKGIKNLVSEQFFSEKNIAGFSASAAGMFSSMITDGEIDSAIDYDRIFDRLVEVLLATSVGGVIGMFGGRAIIESFRKRFREKMQDAVRETLTGAEIKEIIERQLSSKKTRSLIREKLEEMVDARLSELTPGMVKEIIQKMIKKHLGWLVVWGGVFGGLLGFAAGFLE